MTTRLITPEEAERLHQELAERGLSAVNALLKQARLRIVDAPEIGCMPIVREHICQIDAPSADYERLEALSAQDKDSLLQALKKLFEAQNPELSLVEVDFYRQD